MSKSENKDDLSASYMADSLVASKKERLKAMISGHWNYVKGVILSNVAGGFDCLNIQERCTLSCREHDYTTAFAHGYSHGLEDAGTPDISFAQSIQRQKDWTLATFGSGDHSQGLIEHIKKELVEIAEDSSETEEWIDVMILAMDGASRTGASAREIVRVFELKMAKNERRDWPKIGTFDLTKPIEHIEPSNIINVEIVAKDEEASLIKSNGVKKDENLL